MKKLSDDEATAILGEGFHTGLRKVTDSREGTAAYKAIEDMDPDEWHAVLAFLVDGLAVSGIRLVREEKLS